MRTQALHATRARARAQVGITATANHLQFCVNEGKKNPQSCYSRRSRYCRRARARASTIQRAFSRARLAAGFSPRLPRISRLDERVAVIYGPSRACSSPFAETVSLHCTHRGVYQCPPPSNETLHRIADQSLRFEYQSRVE